jgi:hypothetical protein
MHWHILVCAHVKLMRKYSIAHPYVNRLYYHKCYNEFRRNYKALSYFSHWKITDNIRHCYNITSILGSCYQSLWWNISYDFSRFWIFINIFRFYTWMIIYKYINLRHTKQDQTKYYLKLPTGSSKILVYSLITLYVKNAIDSAWFQVTQRKLFTFSVWQMALIIRWSGRVHTFTCRRLAFEFSTGSFSEAYILQSILRQDYELYQN